MTTGRIRAAAPQCRSSFTCWCALALGLAACSAEPVDLGDGRLGRDRSAMESYAAVWEGYIEGQPFASGSDLVRLELDAEGQGRLTFGAGAAPSPPIDADRPFDFGAPLFSPSQGSGELGDVAYPDFELTPHEGFDYSVTGATIAAERVRVTVSLAEVLAPACAIQTPVLAYPSEPNSRYNCLADEGADYATTDGCFINGQRSGDVLLVAGTPASCERQFLCRRFCSCDASACVVGDLGTFILDAALDTTGDRLEGTLDGGGISPTRVRLKRAGEP